MAGDAGSLSTRKWSRSRDSCIFRRRGAFSVRVRRVEPSPDPRDVPGVKSGGSPTGESLEVALRFLGSSFTDEKVAEVEEGVVFPRIQLHRLLPERDRLLRVAGLGLDHAQRVVGAREAGL